MGLFVSDGKIIQAFPAGGFCHKFAGGGVITGTSARTTLSSARTRILNIFSDEPLHLEAGGDDVVATEESTYIPGDIATPVTIKQTATHFAVRTATTATGNATAYITENGIDG